MALRRNSLARLRALTLTVTVLLLLGLLAEFGHAQWTTGGPSGLRGRGVAFDSTGTAAWQESGVSLFRGAIGVWTTERSVAKESFDWGGGGALFFGVNDELGGPSASDASVWWRPQAAFGVIQTGAAGRSVLAHLVDLQARGLADVHGEIWRGNALA